MLKFSLCDEFEGNRVRVKVKGRVLDSNPVSVDNWRTQTSSFANWGKIRSEEILIYGKKIETSTQTLQAVQTISLI
ncbi:hypothetical protein L1987_63791 [Smallanthus sonchifolius]|uniref:Uncharacterized protein n=1 Tax=Smallanthus sonchifolius TaxID=185202 RepID=A0ACB9CEB1_9ASTR|nr:hypothetical protein L1987_63791 [Smallanthus sonchifolius]